MSENEGVVALCGCWIFYLEKNERRTKEAK